MKKILVVATVIILTVSACRKSDVQTPKSQIDGQSAKVINDWLDVQFRLIKNTTGVTHVAYSRHFAYTGIALYESLVNGDNRKKSIVQLLNGSVPLPSAAQREHVFFPVSANAAIADMFRFFYSSKQENIAIIDSLEAANKNKYVTEVKTNFDVDKSIQFGKAIAASVIEFSKQDGASNPSPAYTPLGEGYWEPTAPAFAAPAVPGWGNVKTILPGSMLNTAPAAPIAFSKEQGTPFYNMVKEVYDVSQTLTAEQKGIADFWDDAPNGKYISAFGHWFNIMKQILQKENASLMKAAEAYLRLGISMNEAGIACWKSKYTYNQIRPISYIRKYMGNNTWNSYITTPAHPEYLAAHATLSGSASAALESVFGGNYSFSDNTYQGIGMAVRTFPSLDAAGTEAGMSRLYGGIHYRPSIEAGKACGVKVAQNVKNILITNK